ncbi:unnamed protein product [Notodromas monacha]|uniref:Large ribosomal subunit protein mL38 n=1 Tax=Notodromas monacha TaxID=399045 RepID=A0A7R9BFW6_9CRUS|nr:unnamed protein product [Notodromas monacha]CAG0913364.1 unnamed protein product [Notodromas monacha]
MFLNVVAGAGRFARVSGEVSCVVRRSFSKRNKENVYLPYGPIREHIERYEPDPLKFKTLEQRLSEIRLQESPEKRINIGLPGNPRMVVSRKERLDRLERRRQETKAGPVIESPLQGPTKQILLREWMRSSGPEQLLTIGEHYGIFRDLFGAEYFFYPRVPLQVEYGSAAENEEGVDVVNPVHFGNYLKPRDVTSAPEVSIVDADPDSLWCLVMSTPDGHFTEDNKEYLHYLVGNIKGADFSTGDVICPYLGAFPPKGAGFYRYVFMLYKQDAEIDFSKYRVSEKRVDLKERTFSTLDFYADLQEKMTPASFAFFQSNYDRSVRKMFEETLEMREPIFDYNFPPPNLRPQVRYPIQYAFNYYLDRYKHPQQINKEVLLLRLKTLHPFEGEPTPLKFPLAHKRPWNLASWVKQDLAERALKEGKYKDL